MSAPRFFHLPISKRWLLGEIERRGPGVITVDGKPCTDSATARQLVLDDPREFFDSCDNCDENGRCQGHVSYVDMGLPGRGKART